MGGACLGTGQETGRTASDERILVGAGGVDDLACVRTEVRAEVVGALQRSVADGRGGRNARLHVREQRLVAVRRARVEKIALGEQIGVAVHDRYRAFDLADLGEVETRDELRERAGRLSQPLLFCRGEQRVGRRRVEVRLAERELQALGREQPCLRLRAREHLHERRVGLAALEGRLLAVEPRGVRRAAICVESAVLVHVACHRLLLELLERRRGRFGFGRFSVGRCGRLRRRRGLDLRRSGDRLGRGAAAAESSP